MEMTATTTMERRLHGDPTNGWVFTHPDTEFVQAVVDFTLPAGLARAVGERWVLDPAASPYLDMLAGRLNLTVDATAADGPAPVPAATPAPGQVGKLTVTPRGEFAVRFALPTRERINVVKNIWGRRWDGTAGQWVIPAEQAEAVAIAAETLDLAVTESANALLGIYASTDAGTVPATVRRVGSRVLIDLRATDDQTEALEAMGARKIGTSTWEAKAEDAPAVAAFVARPDVATLDTVDDLLAALHADGERIVASRAIEPRPDADPVPSLARPLRPSQVAGVDYVLRHAEGRGFICDDMGLGKTTESIAVVEAAGAYPAVFIVPASLKSNWKREWATVAPHRTVQVLDGRSARPFGLLRPDVVIINYDVLDAWVDVLVTDLTPAAVVADEAHYIKNGQAIRSQACVALSDRLAPGAVRLALTGTPVLNKTVEYASQLRFLRRLDDIGGPGALQADDLNRRLRAAGIFLRRNKKDVLPELGDRQHFTTIVEGDRKIMAEYRKAEADLLDYLAERAARIAAELGEDPGAAAVRARMRAAAAEHLVAITTLKRIAARAKMAAAKDWLDTAMAEGRKVLVFAHHVDVLDELGEKFAAPVIKGGMTADAKQAIVDGFQAGEHPLVVCGLTAAGVGLTMTAADVVLFVEQGWTPAVHDQAIDRAHGRLNDPKCVPGVYLVAEDTIDEAIVNLIAEKREIVDDATDGVPPDADAEGEQAKGSVLADLIERLTFRQDAA